MLVISEVSFGYGDRPALAAISVNIPERQLVAVCGPNGSGKSTLLKLMARVLKPQSGAIDLDGRPLGDWPPRLYARSVGYLPQEPDPAFPMRAIDIVLTGRAPFMGRFAWERDADYAAAERALELCDASHLAGRYLDEMSGGERKRVFLARVLSASPRLILLDEPLASLDLAHVQQVSSLLRGIVDQTGCTILFASHELNWAAAYCDRMLILQNGSLAFDAPPSQLTSGVVRELFALETDVITSGGRSWLVPKLP